MSIRNSLLVSLYTQPAGFLRTLALNKIGNILEEGRRRAYYAVNNILVETYWEIGRQIVDFEQKGNEKAEYGSALLENLANDLKTSYGKGFNIRNVYLMRKFYLLFAKLQTVSAKLSWSHYVELLSIEDDLERGFYEKECINERLSVRELKRQINSALFYRIALSKDKKGVLKLSKKGQIIEKASDIVKDSYVLDFLNIEQQHRYTETKLEEKLITNLKKFLLELGKGFMFVERQKRITLDNENYYIDLVFYNRILRCFVLIELKIGKLTHKDLGQLQMYVNYYDRDIKSPEENPTIGILLCADKRDAIVRYTLPENNRQIFASKYQLYLPNKKELEEQLRRFKY